MSIIWTLLIVVAAIAAVNVAVYIALRRVFEEEPRADEIYTIAIDDGWRIQLLRFRPKDGSGEPVLLCHGLSANHRNFTIPAGGSLTDFLVEKGYDCWLIDLRGNRLSEPPPGTARHEATFDGYVMGDIPAALDFIRYTTGRDRVHWVGHSLGGMILYAYELVHGREQLASAVTLGSPTGFDHAFAESQSALYTLMGWFPRLAEKYEQALMPVIGWFQPRLRLMPVNWKNIHPGVGPKEFYNLVELPPLPVVRAMMDCALHRYWYVNNDTVNVLAGLKTLRTPLFVIAAARDPIALPSQLREFFEALPGDDNKYVELAEANGYSADYDHIDLAFARHGREEVYEPIHEWIAAHPAGLAERAARDEAPGRPVPSAPSAAETRVAGAPEPVRAEAALAAPSSAPVTPSKPSPAPAGRIEVKPWPGRKESVAEQDETLWGKALKDAADILSGLDESGEPSAGRAGAEPAGRPVEHTAPKRAPSRRKKAAKKKSTKKKAAAKRSTAGKTEKKSSATKPKKTKAAAKKKRVSKSKPVAKKKSPKKKKAAKKKATAKKPPAKKKAAKTKPKRSSVTKKKAAGKKKTKSTAKKKTAKKSVKKKKKKSGR